MRLVITRVSDLTGLLESSLWFFRRYVWVAPRWCSLVVARFHVIAGLVDKPPPPPPFDRLAVVTAVDDLDQHLPSCLLVAADLLLLLVIGPVVIKPASPCFRVACPRPGHLVSQDVADEVVLVRGRRQIARRFRPRRRSQSPGAPGAEVVVDGLLSCLRWLGVADDGQGSLAVPAKARVPECSASRQSSWICRIGKR